MQGFAVSEETWLIDPPLTPAARLGIARPSARRRVGPFTGKIASVLRRRLRRKRVVVELELKVLQSPTALERR
jgi:hypothetical protein